MTLRKVLALLGLTLLALSMTGGPCGGISEFVPSFAAGVGQKQPEWSPDGSMIVFPYGKDLYSVTSNGARLKLITSEKEGILSPQISPDGSQVAYTSLRKGPFWSPGEHWEIKVVSIDGSFKRTLGRTGIKGRSQPYDINPSWSPDGKRIAFVSSRPKHSGFHRWHIHVMDHDGSDIRILAPSVAADITRPSWSSDGNHLAFTGAKEHSQYSSREYAYVAQVAGGGLINLGRSYTPPEWSPEGKRLSFINWERPTLLLVWANLDGSVHRQKVNKAPLLTGRLHQPPFLTWFPGGRKLMLSEPNEAGRYRTHVVDLTRPGPSGEGFETNWFAEGIPSWSPDGTLVAMYSVRKHFLYTILPDGSGRKRLAARGEDRPITAAEWQELEKTKAASTPNP